MIFFKQHWPSMGEKSRLFHISLGSLFLFIFHISINAKDLKIPQHLSAEKRIYAHWFTGPVLTPTPITMPVGHPGLEVAFLVGETYGFYNSQWRVNKQSSLWSVGPYVDFQIGFNEWLGAEYIGALLTNFRRGAHYTHLVDSILRLGFQISVDQPNSWVPDFRILLQETIPTGKYDQLSPIKYGTDSTGTGSFQTGVHFAFQKMFHPKKGHDFRLRGSLGYFFPSPTNLRGINYLGGSSETKGKVSPGQYFLGYLCGEYEISRTWSICLESSLQFGKSGNFEKQKGPNIEVPSFTQFTIAPEVQHTVSSNLGILFGSWLTVSGRNSIAFRNYFVSVLYAF